MGNCRDLLFNSKFVNHNDENLSMNDVKDPQLQALSRGGLAIAGLGALASVGWPIAMLVDPSLMNLLLPSGTQAGAGSFLPLFLIGLVPAALFLVAMIEAFRLFLLLGNGLAFTPAMPRSLGRLGLLAAASALAGLITPTVLGLVATMGAPAGQKQLVIQIGSGEIAALVIALLLFAFSRVMRQTVEIAQENREMV